MAEIKSTLELAMERADRISERVKEREAQEKPETLEDKLKRLRDSAFHRGCELIFRGQLDAAEQCFREAVTYVPDDFRSLSNLGSVLTRLGNFEEAERILQRAIEIKPDDPTLHYNLGKVYQDLEKAEEALGCYMRAFEIDPKYRTINSGIAEIYGFLLNDFEKAIGFYERQLELFPGNVIDINNLGRAHQYFGDIDRAMECFHEVIRIEPDYLAAHSNLANIYYKRRDFERGDRHLEVMMGIDPNDPKTLSSLMVKHRIEDRDKEQEGWLADNVEKKILLNAIDDAERNNRFILYQGGKRKTFVYIDQSMVRDTYVFKRSDDGDSLFRELLMHLFYESTYKIRRMVAEMKLVEHVKEDKIKECFDNYKEYQNTVDPAEYRSKRRFVKAVALLPRGEFAYLVTSRKDQPNLERLFKGINEERKRDELELALDSLAILHSGITDLKVDEKRYAELRAQGKLALYDPREIVPLKPGEKEGTYFLQQSYDGEQFTIEIPEFDYLKELKYKVEYGREQLCLGKNDGLDQFLEEYHSFIQRRLTPKSKATLHTDFGYSNVLRGGIIIDINIQVGDPMLDVTRILEHPGNHGVDIDNLVSSYFDKLKLYAVVLTDEEIISLRESYKPNKIHNAITAIGMNSGREDFETARFYLTQALETMEEEGEITLRDAFMDYVRASPHKELEVIF